MNRRGLRRGGLLNLAGVLAVCSALATMDGFAPFAAALPQWFMVSLGMASIIVGFGLFVIVGGGHVTPPSVVFFGWAVLFAFPITYLASDERLPPVAVQAAISVTCAFLALALILSGARRRRVQVDVLTAYLLRHRKSILTVAFATATLCIVAFSMPLIQILSRRGLIGCAFVIFAVGVALISRRRRLVGGAAASAALLLGAFWFQLVFGGFGRLTVAAIGMAFLCIWTLWFPSTRTKIAMVLAVPFGLTWAGMTRTAGLAQQVWAEGAGLSSVMAPVVTYGELIGKGSRGGFWALLDQLVVSALFWVPRIIWPSKPEGFGRLLVYELRPQMGRGSYTMAASWLGQGFFYLGPIGVLISIVLAALLVTLLNSLFWRGSATSKPSHLFYLVVGVWGGSQLLTFMWAGTFTFATRTGALLFALGALCVTIWLWRASGLAGSGSQDPWHTRVTDWSRRRQGLEPTQMREM